MAYPMAVASLTNVKTAAVTQRYVAGFRSLGDHPQLLAISRFGFSVDFAVSMLAALLILIAILIAGELPGAEGHSALVVVFAFSLPLWSFVGTSIVVLFAFEKFVMIGVLQVLHKGLVLFAVTISLLVQTGPSAFVVGVALGQACSGLIYLLAATTTLGRSTGRAWWTASGSALQGLRRELRSLLGWNFIGASLSGAMDQLPVLILGAIRSPVDAGYFRLASTIAVTAGAVEAAMSRVAYSALAAADAHGDVARIARLIAGWSRREALLGLLAVLSAMALLPAVILVGLGQGYSDMILGTEVLLIGTAVSALFFFVTPYFFSTGRIRTWVAGYGTYAMLSLLVGTLLSEAGGFFAFAAVVGLGLALLNIVLGASILRRVRPFASPLGPPENLVHSSAEARRPG